MIETIVVVASHDHGDLGVDAGASWDRVTLEASYPRSSLRPWPTGTPSPRLASLGHALRDVTFVVLDLETTGGAPDGNGITEIGAVKVARRRAARRVRDPGQPGGPIPPFITVLTGHHPGDGHPAPPIEEALPGLLEFLAGTVFVAHNAPFDTGFLKAACLRHGY
jgi:DNA polymerase-3 subunit epsilon